TPSFAGVVQQQNAAVPRLRRRCDSVHPLHFGGVAHQQSARVTCERQRGQHSTSVELSQLRRTWSAEFIPLPADLHVPRGGGLKSALLNSTAVGVRGGLVVAWFMGC